MDEPGETPTPLENLLDALDVWINVTGVDNENPWARSQARSPP